jgi:hypothetical protein
MAANSTHPEYDTAAAAWSQARDVLGGEDAVKLAGERYLPRLDSQSDEEYSAYKTRASFFGATARTLEEYLDLVFRRGPTCSVAECKELEAFVGDCDGWGLEFPRYARQVVREVLAVGRGGSLVLEDPPSPAGSGAASASGRPVVSFWKAEDIINWQVERRAPSTQLVGVFLRDGERVRVLRILEDVRGGGASWVCVQEMWLQSDGEWLLAERTTVKREGVALTFIPFVFHGARDSRPEPSKLPFADIIAANLDHYRLDADYKHGLHFTALPTAWVSGFDKATPLRIGSSAAWVSEVPGASAGFLEFTGSGLGHIEKAMERAEQRMALLGARMLEGTSVPVSGGAASPVASADLSGLGSIVASLNESLTRVLELAQWWIQGGQAVPARNAAGDGGASRAEFRMNTDLGARAMTGEDISAVVAAWRAGAISRESMLERLKRGEVLPDGRSVSEERALINGKVGANSRK